ncbi:AbrB family transcriptional regulator [Roseovarius sp. 2305UL8-3]|uniref:AbrB family transcriptional regulator n=1 Tax=Roseovarius conchicola TaxID=3121636 RepID=UPI00352943F1
MRSALATLLLIGISTLAAFAAAPLGLPLPYLLGPLIASATICLAAKPILPDDFAYLPGLRFAFIAVIGVMIGAQVTPDLFANTRHLLLSFGALIVFVCVAITFNYSVFRKVGRYDRPTAFYSSMPGGLYESIAFGDEAGADPARLMLQQFLRVIVVVTVVPIGLSLWLGEAVGSAGGMTLAKPDVPWSSLPIVALAILGGIGLGVLLRLPARQLTGPMAMGAALSLSGVIDLDIPQWLVNLALIIVGTALGTRFNGITVQQVVQGMGLALLSVGGMLILAAGLAVGLSHQTGQGFDMMLISFAPGGVTEMTLVALSLTGTPAIVTLHHIARILITVGVLVISSKWMRRRF